MADSAECESGSCWTDKGTYIYYVIKGGVGGGQVIDNSW